MAGEALPAASITKWTGLYRSVDPFAIAPGAMGRADNVVVPGPSLLRPRRGFKSATATIGGRISSLGFYGPDIVFLNDTVFVPPGYVAQPADGSTAVLVGRGASTFDLSGASLAAYGFNVPAATARARFFAGNGNLYQTANFGLARTAAPASALGTQSWYPAGTAVPCPSGGGFLLSPSGTFLADGHQCAYRFTFRWTDANGNDHRGPPSERVVVKNASGAAKGVTYIIFPSAMVLPGTVIETWRTATFPTPADGSDAAGDECFKVAELLLTGANFATGADGYLTTIGGNPFVNTALDNTPDVPFLVEPLYTNPTTGEVNGLGIGNANTPPPAATDVFAFKGRTYYLNTQEIERLTVQIIGTGTGGIQEGDTVVIDGVTFTFSNTLPAPNFQQVSLFYTGGPNDKGSIVENIRFTAAALATAVNIVRGTAGVTFSQTPPDLRSQLFANQGIVRGLPGYVNLRRLVPGASGFTVTAGVGSGRGWAGALASNNTSDSNRQPANLMQSQPDDPESVPPAFTNTVGRLDRPILRGLALRDASYIFKAQGDGLWKFTDDGTGTLVIGPVDQTVNLVAPETAVSLDNAVFCLTDKGVAKITDGGTPELVSTDKVQDDLADLMAYVGPDTLSRVAFAVAYESERMYILCLPESPNATAATVQYVYNLQSEAWTRWTLPDVTCGGVNPLNDHLYFGRATSASGGSSLWEERKALDDSDQQDPGFTATVPGVGTYSAAALVFSGDVTGQYAPGDRIQYISGATATLARVTGAAWTVGSNQTTVTLDQSVTWTAGQSFSVLKGIQCRLELLPLVAGEPLYEKQWQNVYLYLRRATFASADVSYSTEKQQTPVTYPLAGPVQTPWLYDQTLGFGLAPWGGPGHDIILKQPLDQAAARSAELTVGFRFGDALAGWELSALRVPYDPTTMRVVR